MKTTILLVGIFLLSSNLLAQSPQQNLPYTVTPEIKQLDSQIQSFRAKRDAVKADPQEDNIATSQNWYQEVEQQLAKLFNAKRNLIYEQTGKHWISIEELQNSPPKKNEIMLNDPQHYIVEQP